jgi:hypothetical protein
MILNDDVVDKVKNNLDEIITKPHVVHCMVTEEGNWAGTDKNRDPYTDILIAINKLKSSPSYLLMSTKTCGYLNYLNSDRETFWAEILALFIPDIDSCCPVKRMIQKEMKNIVFRASANVPDGIALLVSVENEVVVIQVE